MLQLQEHDVAIIMRKGPWTDQEDVRLISCVNMCGDRRWDFIAKVSGLKRSGKSCRLRWVNYLHPGLKRGKMTPQEECRILELHTKWGNRWSKIARKLPGRTDNEIKNYWRTHMRKKAQKMKNALSPSPSTSDSSALSSISSINPAVDYSISITNTKQRSFYDINDGLKMVTVTNCKTNNYEMKSTVEQQDGYNLMDEIWKDIILLDDDDGTYSEIAPSSIWDYTFNTFWMVDENMFSFPNKPASVVH